MKEGLLILGLLHGADAVQTGMLLSNGGAEKNPLLPDRPALVLSVKTLYASASMFAINYVAKKNRTVGRILLGSAIAAEGFAVVHNARQLSRRK